MMWLKTMGFTVLIMIAASVAWTADQSRVGQDASKTGCQARFDAMDSNQDGVLVEGELMPPRGSRRAGQMFMRKDANGDGKLTSEEFCARAPTASYQDRFDHLDTSKDGKVSKDEFMASPHRRGKADEMFAKKDTNADGALTGEEFCARGARAKAAGR